MGSHLMKRPPKYVHGFIDRHGRPRFYFRRAGFKKIPLPGLPWSPGFMEAYETALAGQPLQIGSARTKPGTVRALAVSYFNSPDFRSLRPSSQAIYRGIIDRFCIQYGDNRVANLKREHVVKLMAARAERPVAANSLRKVLRAMMKHAVEIGLRADDPTRDVRAIRVKSDGYHSWNDDEIAQFEKRHPIGSLARFALTLLLYTGQRRSDVVRMGPQHIRNGVLHVRHQTRDSGSPNACCCYRRDTNPSSDFLDYSVRSAFHGELFRSMVSRAVRHGGLTSLQRAWIEEGCRAPSCGGGLHRARDCGHYRPCQP
jgi:integrase